MIITTTGFVEGRPVREYLGVINAQSIIGANIFKDFLGGLRDVFGGRSKTCGQTGKQKIPQAAFAVA